MNSLYIIALLFSLILATDASPLVKRHNKCCPVYRCVFNEFDELFVGIPGFTGNTFPGILEFTESPKDNLQISGFIDIDGALFGPVEGFYDIHVADCGTAFSETPGDPAIIDLGDQSFDVPIATTLPGPVPSFDNQCCFVVDEFAANFGAFPIVERIYGIATIETVVSCSTTSSSPYPSSTYPTTYSTDSSPYPSSTYSTTYTTDSSPYPTDSSPYPTDSSTYSTDSSPYPTDSSPYPTDSTPYTTPTGA